MIDITIVRLKLLIWGQEKNTYCQSLPQMVDEPMEKHQITIQQIMVPGSTTVVELCERRYQINARNHPAVSATIPGEFPHEQYSKPEKSSRYTLW